MANRKIVDLPITGAGCGEIEIRSNGVDLTLRFSDGQMIAGTLVFDDVTAFRFRDEMHSLGFADGSYDSLIEIVDSAWYKELCDIEPDRLLSSVTGSSLTVFGYLRCGTRFGAKRLCRFQ